MPGIVLRRLYVPVATVVLVFLLGSWLIRVAKPLTDLPPEQRVESGINPELTPEEAKSAHAVIEPGYGSRGGREQLLFLGNSQTMTVPYRQPGDISTPQWLQVLLSRRVPGGVDVHRASLGALVMEETLVRVVDFGESVSGPAAVIIAIRPELINGIGLREEVRQQAQDPVSRSELRRLAASNPDLTLADRMIEDILKSDQAGQTGAETEAPWPKRLEKDLQTSGEGLTLLAERTLLFELVNSTYRKYRNRIFRVTSSSPRPLDKSTYAQNLEALELTLRYARQKGIHIILYLGPVRPIKPNPDSAQEIARIRYDTTDLARHYDVECFDYTQFVPESYWTDYEPTPLNHLTGDEGQHDFAHLRSEGHKLVAEKLLEDVGDSILAHNGTPTH